MTTRGDWIGITVAVRGLAADTRDLLQRQVARFQQARRQACLSRLMATDPRADAIVRRLVPHPALWQEADRWARCLLAAEPDLLGWYRQVLERMPADDLWQPERTFYKLLRPLSNGGEPLAADPVWAWGQGTALDLSPWLGGQARAVSLAPDGNLQEHLAAGRHVVLGQWLQWEGEWVIHLFLTSNGKAGRPGARVAAALLLPSLVAQGGTSYQVRKGDTLWGIAKRNLGQGKAWGVLHELNRHQIANPRLIYPGQRLVMPKRDDEVVVRAGDTLWSLARARTGHGHWWPALWQANRDRLSRPDHLPVGMRLRWPERWQVPMPATATTAGGGTGTSARRPPASALHQALQQRPVAKPARPAAVVSPPPIRFLLPGTMPLEPDGEQRRDAGPPQAVQPLPPPAGETGTLEPAGGPAPVPAPANAPAGDEPVRGAPPSVGPLPATQREGTPGLQPAQPLNRPASPTTDAALPSSDTAEPLSEWTSPPTGALGGVAGSDSAGEPGTPPSATPAFAESGTQAAPAPDRPAGSDGEAAASTGDPVTGAVAPDAGSPPDSTGIEAVEEPLPVPSLPPVSHGDEPIRPATGGTDPWEHWLHPERERRSGLGTAATVLPVTAAGSLWPTIGYQAVPEYLTETIAGSEGLRGWAVNRQRLSAEWAWSGWQLKSRWTFGRYELPMAQGRINRQESWVDLDLGQRWTVRPGLDLGLAARGSWWQRRSAGGTVMGLAAADAQGFGLGPVGTLAWEAWPGQALTMEAALQPLVPVTFAGGTVAGGGQLGMAEGYVGWQGRWGMWQPKAGYRARFTYDADGHFGQLAHGLVVGLSLGWQPAASNAAD